MKTEYAISAEFNAQKTLVFPSEITSRSYLTGYAASHNGKAIFADRAISWDTFKKQFTEIPSDRQKAQAVHRMIFVCSFFQSAEVKKLRHFVNTAYKESLSHFAKNTAANLIYFKKALESDTLSASTREDVELLYNAYCRFLDRNGLYEEHYGKTDFSGVDKEKYVLVHPETVTDKEIGKAIATGIKTIKADEYEEMNPITVYSNSICEIRSAVRKISELLETEKAHDIAITLAQYESCYPYLESECRIRGIKLRPVHGKKLNRYAGGKFFKDIRNLESTDFDLEAIKTFLFNPLYPFKDRNNLTETVKKDIFCKNQNGGLNWKKLSGYVRAFTACRNADELRKIFHNFQDEYFENESWHTLENEVEKQAFERVLVLIDDIDAAMQQCGLEKLDNFYEVFLRLLETTDYTSNIKSEGIKVYSYPSTVAMDIRHHFVLGLSDLSADVRRTDVPFEHTVENNLQDNITDNVLRAYALKTDNKIYISCAIESYESESTAPALFVERNLVQEADIKTSGIEKDSFAAEMKLYSDTESEKKEPAIRSLEKQREWFNNSKSVLLRGQRKDEYAPQSLPVKLNAYKIAAYGKCPYNYFCAYVYNLENNDFEIKMIDALQTGTLLHNTYREFFETVKDFEKFGNEENRKLIQTIFDAKLDELSKLPESPDRIHLLQLSEKYREILIEICNANGGEKFTGFVTEEMEKSLSIEENDYQIKGRIDCILKTPTGHYAVLDFKKGKADKESLQLVIYANMLLKNKEYAELPVIAAFYSIEEKKYIYSWKDEQDFENRNFEFQKLLKTMITKIGEGDFNPTPSKENCEMCDFSRLCRKRFVIK